MNEGDESGAASATAAETTAPERRAATECVERARAIQTWWAALEHASRLKFIEALRGVLVLRRDEIAARVSKATGQPRQEVLCRELLPLLTRCDALLRDDRRARSREAAWHPYGIVTVLGRVASPFDALLRWSLHALASGNAVVVVPAPEVRPELAILINELFEDAGLPSGLHQAVVGDITTIESLLDAGVDHLCARGSRPLIRRLATLCGERLLSCNLDVEVAGVSVVLEEAPLLRAVKAIVWSAFAHNGRSPGAVRRVLIEDRIARKVEDLMLAGAAALRLGEDRDFRVDVGPLSSAEEVEGVHGLVRGLRDAGADRLIGGRRGEAGPLFYEPTVLRSPPRRADNEIAWPEEAPAGPVLLLERCPDPESAVVRVNRLSGRLRTAIWSGSEGRARRLAASLRTPDVAINDGAVFSVFGLILGGPEPDSALRPESPVAREKIVREHWRLFEQPFGFPYDRPRYRILSDLLGEAFAGSRVRRALALARCVATLIRARHQAD